MKCVIFSELNVSRKDAKTPRKAKRQSKSFRLSFSPLRLIFFLGVFASLRETAVHAAPAPRALPPQTESKIRALINAPQMQAGHIGVLISALGTAPTPQDFPAMPYDNKAQPILFAQDADKRFLPASNMKLFTAAMALKVLGPEKTFETRLELVKATGSPANGDEKDLQRAKGGEEIALLLRGGGDPSLTRQGLDDLAAQIAALGIKRVRTVWSDGSLFRAETREGRYPDGWTLDDAVWYYGPVVNALAIERNQVDITLTGTKSGQMANMEMAPQPNLLNIYNHVMTADKPGTVEIDRAGGFAGHANDFAGENWQLNGTLAPGQTVSEGLAIPHPERRAADLLRYALAARNVYVAQSNSAPGLFGGLVVAKHESPPVKELLGRLLKNSDNLYAEMLLRNAAWESFRKEEFKPGRNYAARGHQLIFDWLKENNVSTDGLKFTDGSGLSRYNMVTPRAVAGVLSAVEKVAGAKYFYDALPIAGVDGTMKNRGKGTAAQNNVRAKSGTFSIVSCLSGYVTTKDKQRLSVVILTNFVPDGTKARTMQDQIFATLADADISSNNGTRP